MVSTKENVDINKMYANESKISKEEFIQKYRIKEKGITNEEAETKLRKLGPNEIRQAKPKKWYNYFWESLVTPFNCILIGIALILTYTDVILPETPSYANIIVIAILVIASTLLDFFEEFRSNKAAEKLKKMVETKTTVIRNGQKIDIPIKNVVIGDTIVLSAGSMIPADLRVIEAKDLYVGQSSLTGESDSVKKTVELEDKEDGIDNISDFDNICFMGTLQGWFASLSRQAAQAAARAAGDAAGAAANAFVALAVSIYLLSGKENLLHAAHTCLRAALPPRAAGSVLAVCTLANRIFSGYLGGQLVDALLVGGETFALMSIFGLEYAPLLAVLVGVTNIVPVLGPFLGAVPGIVILLLESPWKAAEFAIIILVVQQVDGNFIAPRILGGATGLPGLGVLLAIVVGGAWFGIPGMALGVPTLAVVAALLKQAVGAGLAARGLDADALDRDFPPMDTQN